MNTMLPASGSREVTIAIDSCADNVPMGRLRLPLYSGAVEFCGVLQLLQEVERALDTMDIPRSFGAMRSFHPPPFHGSSVPDGDPDEGLLATFRLRILFRQNASWQGSVTWLEGRQEQSFRSALELLLLIAGALNEAELIPA